ncbi:dihydropteroate synthase [Rubidibacter lacunae]|nr:dihydropteroate synthase [Rubidibacter lacunae]
MTSLPPLVLRDRPFAWGSRTYIMGVLNVTPDSFSDGGEFFNSDAAIAQASQTIAAGVDMVDVGGQSTRPGAEVVALQEELRRVVPIVAAIRAMSSVPISVDTTRAAVAEAAVAAGADLINDVSGATYDTEMLAVAARLHVPIALMHLRGTPATMQSQTDYEDLIGDILEFLRARRAAAIAAGIPPEHLIFDPGIGFAKTAEQNLELLRCIPKLRGLGAPVLVGVSRKSFIGKILNHPNPKDRAWGTAAACTAAIAGGVDILRVHDVAAMTDVARVADAIWRGR